jgi:catalase
MTPIKENEMTELSHNAIQAFDDLDFLRTLHASGPNAPKPTPIESFLVAHPAALAFVQDPKPFPASFIKESFFAINAYKFTNETGISQHGQYRILPEDGSEHLDSAAAAAKAPNFLFDEIKEKLAEGSVKMRIAVQLDGNKP